MTALLAAAVICAPAFSSDLQWEEAAPGWVAAFARAPFLQQRPDFVRMSTDRKLDVAEWLPLLPRSPDARWRKWYADLGDEGLPPLFARLRDEHDERGKASLLEIAAQFAADRPGCGRVPAQGARRVPEHAGAALVQPAGLNRGLGVAGRGKPQQRFDRSRRVVAGPHLVEHRLFLRRTGRHGDRRRHGAGQQPRQTEPDGGTGKREGGETPGGRQVAGRHGGCGRLRNRWTQPGRVGLGGG